jgi:hypothetical protein
MLGWDEERRSTSSGPDPKKSSGRRNIGANPDRISEDHGKDDLGIMLIYGRVEAFPIMTLTEDRITVRIR